MRTIHFSWIAEEVLGNYYENYRGGVCNDLKDRVLHYRRSKEHLLSFDSTDVYEIDGRKFVQIENICFVEFVKRDSGNEIYVENIYLK